MDEASTPRARAGRLGRRLGLVVLVLFVGPIVWKLWLQHGSR